MMEWIDSISEISRAEWTPLANANALASWGWLLTAEQTASEDWRYRYLLCRVDGRLVGAAVCQLQRNPYDDRIHALAFGRAQPFARRLGLSLSPALICGPCGTYGSHVLVDPSLSKDARDDIERRLIDALQTEASRNRLPLAFVHVLGSQPRLMRQLESRGFARTSLSPMSELEIEWSAFDGYERHVRMISRKAFEVVRNERSRNRREGVEIEVLDEVSMHSSRLIELLDITAKKHSGVPFWYRSDYFSRLKENLGAAAVVYGAWKNRELIGTCVMLKSDTEGFLTEIGVDHERSGNDFTYFNIGYYRPIEDAIASGLERLHFDNALHELKVRRGCRLVDDYLYYKADGALRQTAVRAWFALHTVWFRRKHAYLDHYAHS